MSSGPKQARCRVVRFSSTMQRDPPPDTRTLGLKVFSATKARERDLLGEKITDWIRVHPEYEMFDKIVTQSSDAEFHCLTIAIVYTMV